MEDIYLAVAMDERRNVARALLAVADDPYQVQATSDGFKVPRCVFEAAFPQESSVPAPADPEPAPDPEPEPDADTARDRSGRFAKKKG